MEENPFEDALIAGEWIRSVEGEKEQIRDKYIYPLLRGWLNKSSTGRILDIGCGQGVASQFCNSYEYYGVEPSSALLKRANEIYSKNGTFLQGNAYSLPCKDSYFESAFSINVWFHLEDLRKASNELARVLVPDGKFLIITACPDSYDLWMQTFEDVKHHGKRVDCISNLPLHVKLKNTHYFHTNNEIVCELKEAGLILHETKPFAPCEESDMLEGCSGRYLFQYYSGERLTI